MGDPVHPIPGDQIIDASSVKLTDITPEQLIRLTKVRDGFELAVANILNAKPADLERAGINEKEVARLASVFANDKHICELLPASDKLTEMLHESKQLGRHDMGTIMAEFAAQVRRRADRSVNGAEVLGPFDVLLDYQYGPAAKAMATKAKAKEKAKEASQDVSPPAGETP